MLVRATKKSGQGKREPGHWVEGILLGPVEAGYSVRILLNAEDGQKRFGMLTTSKVRSVENPDPWTTVIETRNSTWELVAL